jgi:hypothetical protein
MDNHQQFQGNSRFTGRTWYHSRHVINIMIDARCTGHLRCEHANRDVRLSTSTSTVRGRWEDGVAVYPRHSLVLPRRSDRRFIAPQPAEPWEGVRGAQPGWTLERDPVGENGLSAFGGAVQPERAGRYRRRREVAHVVHCYPVHAAVGPPDLRDARPGWN